MRQGVTVAWLERKFDYGELGVLLRNSDFAHIDGAPLMSPAG